MSALHDHVVILIENEVHWEDRVVKSLQCSGHHNIMVIRSFSEAERALQKMDLISVGLVLIDVRLRRQLFDQSGLALLDIVKRRRPSIPVLILSAYFDDYPGINKIAKRYSRTAVATKEEFVADLDDWLFRIADFTKVYDAFISYRRTIKDERFARHIVSSLESNNLRIAMDERDFCASGSFLEEMERCIKQSRYTLAIISPDYLASGCCVEEAVICRALDLRERRRRLIPLIFEKAELPYWLHTIVGVDFTADQPLVDPLSRLVAQLR